jgi:IS5 family transposase
MKKELNRSTPTGAPTRPKHLQPKSLRRPHKPQIPATSMKRWIASIAASWTRSSGRNRTKSKVRAKVEHPIGVIKRVFGLAKVRYRGLKKNDHRLLVACTLANLFIVRRHLLRCGAA